MRRVWKIVRWTFTAMLVLIVVSSAGGYLYMRRSLPATTGTITVSGVAQAVDIMRDNDAVPHIYAQSRPDVFFGLGYAHAQDRLWQMEFQRRIGQGRLSEVVGSSTLGIDRFIRTLGVYRAAESAWEHMSAETKAIINAYCVGVNQFIATHQGSQLPPEFTLLRVKPDPWSGADVIVWAKMMAFDSSINYYGELLRADLTQKVGPERVAQLLPHAPPDEPSILQPLPPVATPSSTSTTVLPGQPDPATSSSAPLTSDYTALLAINDQLRGLMGVDSVGISGTGSNAWVVDGTKSATGKPLLANDPHLGARLPSTWYLAHLSAGDFDVMGATIPGLPGVVIGHNRAISWGITNLFPDIQDLYRERLDPSGTQAEFAGQFEPMQIITETIRVRGQADVQHMVRITRHGPLLSDVLNDVPPDQPADQRQPQREPLALRWTVLEPEDETISAFLGINAAQNWQQFTAALETYVGPAQNMVYADVNGNIGSYAAGLVPIRQQGDGLSPVEGWTGASEWRGWVPHAAMPHVYNPPEHFIVSANNRPVPLSYPYFIGRDWEMPYRAQRIAELLQAKATLSPDDFATMQADTQSRQAADLLPLLLPLVSPQTPDERHAVELLTSWDRNVRGDSAAAAIYAAWLQQIPQGIVGDELGTELTNRYEGFGELYGSRFLGHTLKQRTSPWCDNVTTAAAEDCAAVAQQTLAQALQNLQRQLGKDISAWRWDKIHIVVFAHDPLSQVPVIQHLFGRRKGNGGDYSTINVGPFGFGTDFEQYGVPSYRQIVDLAQLDNSRFIQAIGQSGHFLSPHYDDYLDDWHAVRHRPMRFTDARVDRNQAAILRLQP